MSKSARVRLQDLRALLRLVGECRDLGDDPEAWRHHLYDSLARLTGSALVTAADVAGIRAGQQAWVYMDSRGWENGLNKDAWIQGMATFNKDPDFSKTFNRYTERLVREDGIALARTDLLRDREWEASVEYWGGCRPMGVNHSLACFRALPGVGDLFTGISLWRAAGERNFVPRDLAVVREAYAALVPLIGGALAPPGEPSPSALAPRVRQVLGCLLEGDGDKQIAARLGLARHTVNQYAKAIFQHFGVQSRAELLARWVRRGHPQRFRWQDE